MDLTPDHHEGTMHEAASVEDPRSQVEHAPPPVAGDRAQPVTVEGSRLDAGQCACGGTVFRRDVCRTCYRKFGEEWLPVGDDRRADANALRGARQVAHRLSHAPTERLAAIMRALDPTARQRLADVLAKVGE